MQIERQLTAAYKPESILPSLFCFFQFGTKLTQTKNLGWMASPTQWTRVWVNSWSWLWTGRPGVLQFMGLQRVRHDWATELNWWLVGRGVRCYSHFRELRPSKLSKKGRTEAHTLVSRLHSPCPSCSARCSLSNVNMLGLWDTKWRKITVIISRPLSSETNSTKFSYFLTQHNNLH